jgi:CRP/FNR family transcriptional regulator, dissimilatory nitrate respiration regulator
MPEKTPEGDPFHSAQTLMIGHTLRRTPMFADIGCRELDNLATGCHLRSAPKGTYLFHSGEPATGFFVVHSGAVNVHRVTEDGREQVIRVFYPGESLGEVVLVGDQSYPASAKTIEDSQVIVIPTDFFRQQVHQNPDLALRILASMSLHLRYLIETVEGLKLRQAESRVVQWLLRLLETSDQSDSQNPQITLPLAKHLLASQLGITSETLSRVFARLRKENLISIDGKLVQIHSVDKLKGFVLDLEYGD